MRNIKAELEHSISELQYIKEQEQAERKRNDEYQRGYQSHQAMNNIGNRYQTRYDTQPALNMNSAASQYDTWYYAGQQSMSAQEIAKQQAYIQQLGEYSSRLMGRTVMLSKELADLIPSEEQMAKFAALREAWAEYQLVRRMCLEGGR